MKLVKSILGLVLIAATGGFGQNSQRVLLRSFAEIMPIDAHVHFYQSNSALAALFERLQLRAVNICVIDDRDPASLHLEPQRTQVLQVRGDTHGRAAFATTFDPYGFEEAGFAARTVRQLNDDFAHGAVAVKIYKVMGMEMKSKAGRWVMADDPGFAPIYRDIADHHRTVIAHLAEPDSCWQAPNPPSPDFSYYNEHPEEYAYAHPDWPRKEAILAARDHLLEQNPKLRVVGAHWGAWRRMWTRSRGDLTATRTSLWIWPRGFLTLCCNRGIKFARF